MNLFVPNKTDFKKEELSARLKELNVLYKDVENANSKADPSLKISPYYLDMKIAYGDPKVLRLVAEIFADKIKGHNKKNPLDKATFVYSSGNNGIPIAAQVAVLLDIKNTMIRDRPKNHGDHGFIDGYIPSSRDRGFQIADTLVTGDSCLGLMEKINPARTLGVMFAVARSNKKMLVESQYAIFTPSEYTFLKNDLKRQ